MRQKKIKDVEKKMEFFSEPLVSDPLAFKGRWREAFRGYGRGVERTRRDGDSPRAGQDGDSRRFGAPLAAASRADAPLHLEIGCGKGRFIKASALKDPDSLYLGFEGQKSAIYRALQRAYTDPDVRLRELNEIALALVGLSGEDRAPVPGNLLLCAEYIMDMRDYFGEGELSGVFLNFSDPWPKTRQRKRRLTSPGYLDGYMHALAYGGFIRFKTDSADFFDYSRECLGAHPGFEITALTDDLHTSGYAADSETTEYERRFLNLNMKIHYLEARKSARSFEYRRRTHAGEERDFLRVGDGT
ncbi:MAG: tRNA (guanosine(46)-N7)-methyltransferase TrmB [Clostridiales Family XIII bacterium]|jgi:tRNA (guanine-N7-)-methyltransferase|nr:tRNA (guanosine(46)-N7)-methyltransferase TrmB [Clostridiales Family XIII bacterium]